MKALAKVKLQLVHRLKGFAVHVSIGLLVFIPLLYLIVFRWYPGVYFLTDGGSRGLLIVFLVDLVIGPALTFTIFSPGKAIAKIRFDLAVIACLQISALCWGVYAVHDQRPVAVALWDGAFRPVTAAAFSQQSVPLERVRALSDHRPPLVFVRPPVDADDASQAFFVALNEGLEPFQQFDRYLALDENLSGAAEQQISLERYEEESPALRERLRTIAEENGLGRGEVLYIGFEGRYRRAVLVLSTEGELLGAAPI